MWCGLRDPAAPNGLRVWCPVCQASEAGSSPGDCLHGVLRTALVKGRETLPVDVRGVWIVQHAVVGH